LGRLAALGWFTQSGEVAATQAVAVLLEEPPLQHALLRRLAQITETDLASVALQFQAELVHDDLARPDLEGRDSRGRPLVVIEAKFGARLTAAQLQAYMTHQVAALDGGVRGALIVLVPSYRGPEAEAVLSTVGTKADERSASTPSVATAVLTWDELLGLWDEAAQELPADDQAPVVCDLRQLRALCKTMAALDIAPLGLVATGSAGWQEREGDLQRLVSEATARFPPPGGRLPPLGLERWPEFGYYRRYLPGRSPDTACQCAVGVILEPPDQGTPFWLRYSRTWCKASFQSVADRIMTSRFAADARGDFGGVWVPLRISPDRSGAAIVDELVEQIEEIRAIAAGAELPEAGAS